MNLIFVDTSFLIAFAVSDDEHHARAVAWRERITGRLLVTDYVLVEFMDALSYPHVRDLAADATTLMRKGPGVVVVQACERLFEDGFEYFTRHSDKHWSLTDCISFVVMKEHGVREALSSDHHFEQAGFRALLREEPT